MVRSSPLKILQISVSKETDYILQIYFPSVRDTINLKYSSVEACYKYLKVSQHCAYATTQEWLLQCNTGIDTYHPC